MQNAQLKRVVETTLKGLGLEGALVELHLVDKKEITKLHKIHFKKATPTDCISLAYHTPKEIKKAGKQLFLGEVYVCPEVAQAYAAEHDLDPQEELLLYIIHGILHLVGYKDGNAASKKAMRAQEK